MDRWISWLLNSIYLAALLFLAPLIVWQSLRTGKYRDGYREKLIGLVPWRCGDATCIWIHAVSVGEVNLLATILDELRAAHPDWQIVVSTTSRAGHELARKKFADVLVFYCPLDFSWAVRAAMRRVRPTMLVLAELELWPNLILAAKERGAHVAIINGRLSDKSFPGYRRVQPLVARTLRHVDLIAAQNEESAERFRALGARADRVRVTGSMKYDGAETDRDNPRTAFLRQLAGFSGDEIILLFGSTQEPEEHVAVDIFRRLSLQHPRLRLVLVPRHAERFDDVAKLLEASALPWERRSALNLQAGGNDRPDPGQTGVGSSSSLESNHSESPILLVDTIGELGAWWGTASLAFVGGSFGSRGGQNMIEPAAYGAAVSFGPNTWNFRDIVSTLLAADAAVVVANAQELEAFIRRSLEEPAYAVDMGNRAQALVRSQLGATARTAALLHEALVHRTACSRSAAA